MKKAVIDSETAKSHNAGAYNKEKELMHNNQLINQSSPLVRNEKKPVDLSFVTENKWFAIYVKSRHEKCVHEELQQKGIESSLPLMNVTRQWSDRKKKVEVPLFRGYVFVNIDIKEEKFLVLTTTGVVKFVTFCNKTVSIPEEQMFWLDQLLLSELNIEYETNFPVGAEVDVMFGPLKGLQGRVKQKNSESRLVVWFDAIMQGVSVEIDPACLKETEKNKKAFSYKPLAPSYQQQAARSQ